MLLWDMTTDSVVPGQWLRGIVLSEFAEVTPDCSLVAYHASDHRYPSMRSVKDCCEWVAVSRPPYFTAIGMWSTHRIWPQEIEQNTNLKDGPLAKVALSLAKSVKAEICSLLIKNGWNPVSKDFNRDWREIYTAKSRPIVFTKFFGESTAFYEICWKVDQRKFETSVTVIAESGNICLTLNVNKQALWIDTDASGRLVFADKGCLWAWANFPEGEPTLIADLNGNTFEEVPPPAWALKP